MKKKPPKETNLKQWLWKSACTIRGEDEASKFKDYILPLVFFKRLCDVFDDELDKLSKKFKERKKAYNLIKADNKIVRFFLPFCPKDIFIELLCAFELKAKKQVIKNNMSAFLFTLQVYEQINHKINFL